MSKFPIENISAEFKSRFVEMFGEPAFNSMGWKSLQIKDVCLKVTDGEHGSVPRTEMGHIFLNAKHILKNGCIDFKSATYVADDIHKKIYKRCNPETGDILLTTTGTIGNVAIVDDICDFSMDRGITLLKINRDIINSKYLFILLKFDYIQNLMNINVHVSAIGHLFLNMVKSLPVIVPPIELQNQFAAFAEATDKSKFFIESDIKSLEICMLAYSEFKIKRCYE